MTSQYTLPDTGPDADAPLRESDVLVHAPLCTPDGRGLGWLEHTGDPAALSGVRCGRPLVYPVPAEELPTPLRRRAATGRRYLGVLLAFDLDPLPGAWRYLAARFDVGLADERATAVRLDADGDELGLGYDADGRPWPASRPAARVLAAASAARPGWPYRLVPRRGQPRAWTTGTQSPRFGWNVDDPRGTLLLPRTYAMHALVEVPADLAELRGTLGVHVEAGLGRDRRHAALREAAPFAEPLPDAGTIAAGTIAAGTDAGTIAAGTVDAFAVRLCMAADVAAYSGRTNRQAERVQRRLVEVLARARRAAGIDESTVEPQAQGDGQFTVLPAGIDESTVIPRLVRGIDEALRAANRDAGPDERIRLRTALHRGSVKRGDNGWIGVAAIAVHRILDSPPLRAALRDNATADFVLGVPDVLYHDVIEHLDEPPRPEEFTAVTVDLPDKRFVEHGWIFVPRPGPERR